METEFIPIDYDYFDFNEKTYLLIYGRDSKGKRVAIIDSFDPYFWVVLKPGTKAEKIKEIQKIIETFTVESSSRTTKVLGTEICDKSYLGKPRKAIKISITNYKDAHAIADKIDFDEVEVRREYDINLITKYNMDKKLVPLKWYKINGELLNNSEEFGGIDSNLDVDFCVKLESFKEIEKQEFSPKILAFDIEVEQLELGKGKILMISLYSENFKKVLTWKHCNKKQDFVECFKSEEEMLEKFVEYVKKISPDILVGYFSDGFDLPYLRARAIKNKVKLDLGLDGKNPRFARGRIPSARIAGIVHVDIFRFIETAYSQYLQSETLSLDEVASELIGEGKKDFDMSKIGKMKDSDWKEFFDYNLQDSKLTWKLAGKIWPDMLEFSRIMQEPLFEVVRNGMSKNVESYIFHNLEKFNEIGEKRPLNDEIEKRRAMGKYAGAFVLEPKPGLYEEMVMLDFTSMYASVTVSYNLSLSTKLKKKEKNALEVDLGKEGKAYFSKEKGFFPLLLSEIIELRKKYKQEYKKNPTALLKARSNAYKLLANASYGYQGFFGARYYCREAAASTAALAKKNILEAIEKFKKEKYEVVYSDTDSIAILQGKKTKDQVLKTLDNINSDLPGIMALDLEDFYKRGLFVSKRTTTSGAKKKYALISESGKVKIRGFETVRRDWCSLSREVQSKVIEMVLEDGNSDRAFDYIKKIIDKLNKRQIPQEELIIKTQLKKPISEYRAISPHVTAAKKMQDLGLPVSPGMMIEFYVSEIPGKGKKLVRDRIKLPSDPGKYDIEYYINHQILPAVENIFEIFNINLKQTAEGKNQKSLMEF